jgi:hypothetical protein
MPRRRMFLSPLADLKDLEFVNSSSVGAVGSGCFCFRVVRFLVGPTSCCLRRGLWATEVIGSSWFRCALMRLRSSRLGTQGRHMPLTSHIRLFLLNSHLTKCFSVFFFASQSIFLFLLLSGGTRPLTNREIAQWSLTCTRDISHTRRFHNAPPASPISSDGSCIGP